MGYTSRVGICMTKEYAELLHNNIQKVEHSLREILLDLLSDADVLKDDDGCQSWYWDCYKWYSDDPDIAFLESYLESIDWNQFLFLRIGEDLDDVDCMGNFWDNPFGMSLVRDIAFS